MNASFSAVLHELSDEGQLVHLETIPARPARYGELARPMDETLVKALGVDRLWSHQAAAIDAVRDGRSLVVATGTASGKSLCYQAPIVEAVVNERATALLVFPTKALAQDQLRSLIGFGVPDVVAATYDGDTGPEARTWVRRNANVILTNPEMLHGALLPFHARWATYLRDLRYVVIDELHVLRGVFGTHVGHVLRRLQRLCSLYGSSPTFVFSSATIGEPATLASALCGRPVEAITDDGSPRGERLVALWNPPLIDPDFGVRASAHGETERVMAALVDGHRTVAFCRSRRATEVVAAGVRRRIGDGTGEAVRAYRAGYLALERREIEEALFTGRLRGVVATSALELGVDIGGLDACVLDGFPGTIASMRQQMGRAGREQQPSVAVLVAGTDQLDQWLMHHPREALARPAEPAVVNLENPHIAHPHLCCAAFEHPLTEADERWWGESVHTAVLSLVRSDRLRIRNQKGYWNGWGSPAPGIGLRSGTSDEFRIVDDDGRTIGTVDGARAFETVHDGAIYLHQGQQFRVLRLNVDDRLALVTPDDSDEYTQVRSELDLEVIAREQTRPVGRARLSVGRVEVTSRITGYERRASRTREVIGRETLDLPPSCLATRALWYTVGDDVLEGAGVGPDRVPGTLHALEHAAIGILPLFAICDRWDVGGISIAYHADTQAPSIFIYDGYPGGAGIADLGFDVGRRHLEATLAVIERCRCASGCPSCVQSPKCGNGNDPLDKAGAVALLRAILY